MAEFKIGDRVRVIKEHYGCAVGEEGTVISIEDDASIGVRFDHFSLSRHTCRGRCEIGYGWYTTEEEIELISKDNKINTKENNMRFIRDMQVEVTEVYEVNKKNNTKDKYMITTVSTPLGKASVKCAAEDYNKDEGVHLACAKITANQSEKNMILWHIAMDTWGSMVFESIINRFADKACIGSFDKAYRDYLKGKNLEYKKSCICKTCGTKFETPELAREHEKWHISHKKEKYEAYLIRKEAKKRIAEAEREGRIESLMTEIVQKGAENKES